MSHGHKLTSEEVRKGGSRWTPAKAEAVGPHFQARNDQQHAESLARFKKIKALRESGLPWAKIAAKVGMTTGSAKALYRKHHQGKPLSEARAAEIQARYLKIKELRAQGLTWTAVAAEIGMSRSAAITFLKLGRERYEH